MIIVTSSFSKRFAFRRKCKVGVFKFFRFEERLRDGLVWKVELSVEIKLNFQISPHIVEGT